MVLLERNAKQETKQLSKLEFWLLKDYYNEESSFTVDIKERLRWRKRNNGKTHDIYILQL